MPWQVPSDYERGVQSASWLGGAAKEIQDAITQQKMNTVANQLMNSGANAPRAALVSPGVSPTTGQANVIPSDVSTAGTPPQTGGVAAYTLRQKAQEQDVINQLRQAQTVEALQRYSGLTPYQQEIIRIRQQQQENEKAQKQAAIDAKDQEQRLKGIQAWQKQNTLTYDKLVKDFNTVHSNDKMTNAAALFYNAYASGTGHRVKFDPSAPEGGAWVDDPNGEYYFYGDPSMIGTKTAAGDFTKVPPIKMTELQDYLDKKKQIEASGGTIVPVPRAELVNPNPKLQSAAPNPSSTTSIPQPASQAEYDALPSGSSFVDGDGITKTKP